MNNDRQEKAQIMVKEIVLSFELAIMVDKIPSKDNLIRSALSMCTEDEKELLPIPNRFLSKCFTYGRRQWRIVGFHELRKAWLSEDLSEERSITNQENYQERESQKIITNTKTQSEMRDFLTQEAKCNRVGYPTSDYEFAGLRIEDMWKLAEESK